MLPTFLLFVVLLISTANASNAAINPPPSSLSKAGSVEQSAAKPIKEVIVVGGGIGGLTTALALSRISGLKVRVLEKARSYSPTAGAGFGFSPNGQLCLVGLGIPKKEVQALIHPIKRTILSEGRGATKLPLTDNENYAELGPNFGFFFGGALRANTVNLLYKHLGKAGVRVDFNTQVTNVEQEENGHSKVKITLNGGRQLLTDMVVGADGIGSTVAKCVFNGPGERRPLVYSKENIFYGVVDEDSSRTIPTKTAHFRNPFLGLANTMYLIFDKGEFITFRCGRHQQRGQGSSNPSHDPLIWALTYRSKTPPDRAQWGTDSRCREELERVLSRLHPSHPAREMVDITRPECLTHFGMFYQRFKTKWHRGRVVLMGDAAHATLPYVGMGAIQAKEDSYVLAQCLKKHNAVAEPAFQEFYQRRSARTKKFVDLATTLGKLYHVENPMLAWARDRLLTFVLGSKASFDVIKKEVLEDCPVDYRDFL